MAVNSCLDMSEWESGKEMRMRQRLTCGVDDSASARETALSNAPRA
jgi:hypothetical protein